MKRFATMRPLTLLLLLASIANPVFGQLSNDDSSSKVATQIYKSEVIGESPYKKAQEENYNPWTIHRKVAQYGLAGSMGATMLGALAMNDNYFATTVIPVVGPFVTITRVENDPNAFYRPGGKPLLIASGVTQTVFLTYLTIAWVGESSYEARQQSKLTVVPTRSRAGTGLYLQYRF